MVWLDVEPSYGLVEVQRVDDAMGLAVHEVNMKMRDGAFDFIAICIHPVHEEIFRELHEQCVVRAKVLDGACQRGVCDFQVAHVRGGLQSKTHTLRATVCARAVVNLETLGVEVVRLQVQVRILGLNDVVVLRLVFSQGAVHLGQSRDQDVVFLEGVRLVVIRSREELHLLLIAGLRVLA